MPQHDYQIMDNTLLLVMKQFPQGVINTLEIGVRDGRTSRGIHQFLSDAGRINFHTGIDNNHDMETPVPFDGCNLIIGNSMEVFNQVADDSQHLVFQDGCHNLPMTMVDFLLYAPKVRSGGYFAFHDTSPLIKPFTDYQGMGSKEDPDMYISCRKALNMLGITKNGFPGWGWIWDTWDTGDHTGRDPRTGGIYLIQKL